MGQFILACSGEAFIADLGSGEYTAGYFGAERYTYACNSSLGHSVPIINGCLQEAGQAYKAVVQNVELTEEADVFELDIAGAYTVPHLRQLVRRFVWHKSEKPVLELVDTYAFTAEPQSIVERFVTRTEPLQESAGTIVVPGSNGQSLRIHYDQDAIHPVIVPSVYSDHFGVPTPWYAIDFSVKQPAETTVVSVRFEYIHESI
ncbi:heparinase II/III family protein [Paenibacillus hexagrammi]|uniref:hypothetical protein n=1 Tax=Paenibacillus hexagrammi TaxID=2908839 RepID=UPI0038621B84